MNRLIRRALLAAALAASLTPTATALADPVTDLAADSVAVATDAVGNTLSGCLPYVTSWSPEPLRMDPYVPAGSTSTWYLETSGGTARLSCAAAVMVRARLADVSAPTYDIYSDPWRTGYTTSKDPKGIGTNRVPYFGPDAQGIRPYGEVSVRVEVYYRLSTGRYSPISNGCMQWEYVVQPAYSLIVTDPRSQGTCSNDAVYLAADTLDSFDGA